jgi:hypothetical protein
MSTLDNKGLERTRARANGLRAPCRSIQCYACTHNAERVE